MLGTVEKGGRHKTMYAVYAVNMGTTRSVKDSTPLYLQTLLTGTSSPNPQITVASMCGRFSVLMEEA